MEWGINCFQISAISGLGSGRRRRPDPFARVDAVDPSARRSRPASLDPVPAAVPPHSLGSTLSTRPLGSGQCRRPAPIRSVTTFVHIKQQRAAPESHGPGLVLMDVDTDAMCNLPQFAESLGKCTVFPCYCSGLHVLLWEIGSRSPSVVLMPRLDGLAHQSVSRFRLFRRVLLCAASAAKGHWNHIGATACPQGARDFLYSFRACVDTSPKP